MKINLKDIYNKSNLISIFRMLLVIPTIYFLSEINEIDYYRIIVIILFFAVYVSDILDGYIARKYNEVTELGKIIDPLADKIYVIVIIIKLYQMGEIPEIYFWIILLRDVIIFFGGIIVSNIIGKVLPSNLLGKITVVSIAFFLLGVVGNAEKVPWLYNFLYYSSLFLSFASVIGYAIRGIESVRWYKKNENI